VQCEVGVYPTSIRVEYKQVVSPREASAPLVFNGRLSSAGRTLAVRYDDGITDRVPVGLRGYFVYQPAAGLQRVAKTNALRLVERNRAGTITDTQVLQPPIIISKSSQTSPRVIKGRLFVRGARYVGVTLDVFANDGSSRRGSARLVPVERDGRFTWRAPKNAPRPFDVVLRVLDSRFGVLVDLGI
jgi:hypothetical protein